MPRIARAVAPGHPHHVIQRGNNRGEVFFDKEDRKYYLSLIGKYSQKWKSSILAYCLMSNHVHLLTKFESAESLGKMMQGIALCHTQFINRKYNRTGRLWESRFHSFLIDGERYLWAVARYIEQNPVRGNMVAVAEGYPYSSAGAHVCGLSDPLLGEELFDEKQRKDYISILHELPMENEMNEIRSHVRSGRPLCRADLTHELEQKLRRPLLQRPRGRPKKREEWN